MTPEIATTLALLLIAVVLFATDKLPVDIVGIILVMALVITGVLSIDEALSGFGNNIIITLAGLFILTGSLVKTGIVDELGRSVYRKAGNNEFLLTVLVMLVAAFSASFLKNTTTTAMLLPVVLGLATRAKIAPSKLLIPLAFGAILGGSATLIGTSTNLAVSGAMERYAREPELAAYKDALAPYSMFELTPVAVVMVIAGLIYMLFLGRKMLPNNEPKDGLTDKYGIREYISEVIVLENSSLIGKSLSEADIRRELNLNVLGIVRGAATITSPSSREIIEPEDVLIVEGKLEDIMNVRAEVGLEIRPDFRLNQDSLESRDVNLFEILVMDGSRFVGQTLKTLGVRQQFAMTVLAINRHGMTFMEKMSEVPIRFGDVLLVQGDPRRLQRLIGDGELMMLDDATDTTRRVDKRKWALLGFGVFLLLSLSGILFGYSVPLAIAVLIGVMVVLSTKTVRYSEIYSLIDFRLVVLIACMMSFGVAMEATGTDIYLANLIVENFESFGGLAVMAGFFVLTVLLTQPMSNQAAALVVLPVAIQTAVLLGLNPRAFAVAVTFASSFSFITPLEPACVLVYTPGRYRFMDFVKVGTILTVIVFILSMILIPWVWGMGN
jgi:di/tricarboxylate transporter